MDISGFDSSNDLQYWSWGVEEMIASMLSDDESRPLKQLRRTTEYSSFGNTNCSSRDRNLAERNRREKMSLRFTALSALLPQSKKMREECSMSIKEVVNSLHVALKL